MTELHVPWLELAVLVPLLGSALIGSGLVGLLRDPERARRWAIGFSSCTLLATIGAWQDFFTLDAASAHDPLDPVALLVGHPILVVDELSAPLLPMVALLFLLTSIGTLRTKIRRFSFAWTLFAESVALATLSCQEAWWIIGLLCLGTIPPAIELRARGRSIRVYALHMALFVALLVGGWTCVTLEGEGATHSLWAVLPVLAAVLIRCGIAPLHCWLTDLFERATFGTALLFATPMMGAYAAVRLVLPIASDGVLQSMGLVSLATAVYAAGMALVQREARRFFVYVFLSHSALVLVGLETASPLGLTGALCVWLSVGLALTGFGLALRAIEARRGRLSLVHYHGGYEQTPTLAICFLLTGLASVGFPGCFGFVATELLIDGAVQVYPHVGIAVVVAAALNGVAVVKTYFQLFGGAVRNSSVALHIRRRERFSVLALAFLILAGGVFPQPGVASRRHAADELLRIRNVLLSDAPPPHADLHAAE